MDTSTALHAKGYPVLQAKEYLGQVWIAITDSKDLDDVEDISCHLHGKSFEEVRLACAAFNAVMSGRSEGYLAPTQPEIPAQAAE